MADIDQGAQVEVGAKQRRQPEQKMNSLADEKSRTKFLLDAEKKYNVILRQNPGNFPQLPKWFGSINGYPFQIERSEPIEVPESLYFLLVQCNEVLPQRSEDKALVPKPSVYPIERGYITDQVKSGLINSDNSAL